MSDTRRPTNARDDLYNGGSTPIINLGSAEAECRAALREFSNKLPNFCKRLDIAPAVLNLRTSELLMLICIRQQAIIDDLAQQVSRLAFPPSED